MRPRHVGRAAAAGELVVGRAVAHGVVEADLLARLEPAQRDQRDLAGESAVRVARVVHPVGGAVLRPRPDTGPLRPGGSAGARRARASSSCRRVHHLAAEHDDELARRRSARARPVSVRPFRRCGDPRAWASDTTSAARATDLHRRRTSPAARQCVRESHGMSDADTELREIAGWLRGRAAHRRADGRRHLDGVRHPGLPRAPGSVDQEPGRGEDGDAVALRRRARDPAARVAQPARVARLERAAERRAPRAGARSSSAGQPAPADHPERRRAAPGGGHVARAAGRDPRHAARGDVPGLRRARADGASARARARRRGRPAVPELRGDPEVGDDLVRPEPGRATTCAAPSAAAQECDLLFAIGSTLSVYPDRRRSCRSPSARARGS